MNNTAAQICRLTIMKPESINRGLELKHILQDNMSLLKYVSEAKLDDPFCGGLKG